MNSKHFLSTIGLVALLVFVGQGCPGQQSTTTDTTAQGDAQVEAGQDNGSTSGSGELEAGSETAFGIAIPTSADRITRRTYDDGDESVSFRIIEGDIDAIHAYLLDQYTRNGWEIENELLSRTSRIRANKDGNNIAASTSTVATGDAQVTIVNSPSSLR